MMSEQVDPEDTDEFEPIDPEEEETAMVPVQRAPSIRPEDQLQIVPGQPLEFPAPVDDTAAESPAEVSRPPADAGPPAAESPARIIAAISQLARLIEERVSLLQSSFEREVRAEATRERIVDRLHAELQEYKQDLLLKVQRPIFIDLIQLHDDIGKMIEAQPAEEAERATSIPGTLESIRTALVDILYRQGVEPFQNEGDDFDPRRQRAVTTIPTEDPARNKTIAARLRPGFQAGDKIIRAEIVSVHTLKK
jgi:molecular chaperone GrpE